MKKLIQLLLVSLLFFSCLSPIVASETSDYSTDVIDDEILEIQGPPLVSSEGDNYGVIDLDLSGLKERQGQLKSLDKAVIPASYDSRSGTSVVTDVKNQTVFGTCWSFAAVAASESYLVKRGITSRSIDLSELQIAYFGYKRPVDPLGIMSGYTSKLNSNPANDYMNTGGTIFGAMLMMANYVGTRTESNFNDDSGTSYSKLTSMCNSSGCTTSQLTSVLAVTIGASNAFKGDYRLNNAYMIDGSNSTAIKEAIMTYGALHVNYYQDNHANYFQTSTGAYHKPSTTTTNHAVTVIGWNDDYAISNFNSYNRPSIKGAWLIKNSWGTNWGNSGYFWISYDTPSFKSGYAIAYDLSSTSYKNVYAYDASAFGFWSLYNDTQTKQSAANIYTISGDNAEAIKAVSFYTESNSLNYKVQIYKNVSGSAPNTGTIAATKSGSLTYMGYNTVVLDSPISVVKGERVSVIIELTGTAANKPTIVVDQSFNYANFMTYTMKLATGRSYFYNYYANAWTDLYNSGAVARIKLMSDAGAVVPVTNVSLNSSSKPLDINETFQLVPTVNPSTVPNKAVTYTSSFPAVATVSNDGLITGKSGGTTVVTVTSVQDNSKSATCNVTVQTVPVTGINATDNLDVYCSYTSNINASIAPANATIQGLTYQSLNTNVATVDSNGVVKGISNGIVTIRIKAKDGAYTGFKDVTVNVIDPVYATNFVLTNTNLTLQQLSTTYLDYTVIPVNSIVRATYKSSNTAVAVVDTKGNIIGLKAGVVNISMSLAGISQICEVTVINSTPSDLTVSRNNYNSQYINFSTNNSSAKHQLYYATSKTGTYKLLATLSEGVISYLHQSLKTGTTYYYKVRATNSLIGKAYYSAYSGIASGKTVLETPEVEVKDGMSRITIESSPVSGASGYEYYYSPYYSSGFKLVKSTSSLLATKTGLGGGKSYYARVRAYRTISGKKVFSSYSTIGSTYVDSTIPSVRVSGKKYGGINKGREKWYTVNTYTYYWNMRYIKYTVKNTGKFNLTIYNRDTCVNVHYHSGNLYLANSKGKAVSGITIKPGKTVTLQYRLRYPYYYSELIYSDSFGSEVRYDGATYFLELKYNSAGVWYYVNGLDGKLDLNGNQSNENENRQPIEVMGDEKEVASLPIKTN